MEAPIFGESEAIIFSSASVVAALSLKPSCLRLLDSGFAVHAPIVWCVSAKVSRLKEWVIFVLMLRTKDLESNPFCQSCVSIVRVALAHVSMAC